MIFSVPAMKNGALIRDGRANINPTNNGLIAAPVVRATPVIPAAADRSSALTTAMGYDCLVGTRLPSRYVHLTNTETHQQNQDSQRKIRHQRHKNQQNVRREVRDNHGIDKTEARSKA